LNFENPSKRDACGEKCTLVAICVSLRIHRYCGNSTNINNLKLLDNLGTVAHLLLSTQGNL
jgi:hypothetical protein